MRLYENQPSGTVAKLRALRRNATEAEMHLLRALKDVFPQLKWRFQVPFGPYTADILCFSARLVIEVDGGQHALTQAYDAARMRLIEQQGYRVLRFWNNDVFENTEGVIEQISFSLWEKEGARAAEPRGKDEGDEEKGDAIETASPSPFRRLTAAPSLSHREREL